MGTLTDTFTIERDGEEIEVEVEFTISPYIPATGPTYACGGQPAEGGEVEILSALKLLPGGKRLAGIAVELTDAEVEIISTKIAENAGEYDDDEPYNPEPDWGEDLP